MTPQKQQRDARPHPVGFWSDFRRFFVRGLAAALPTLLTVALIVYVYNFIQNYIGQPINAFLIDMLHPAISSMDHDQLEAYWEGHWYLRSVGFVAAIIGVYLIGRLVASFIGRSIWKVVERALFRTPIIRQIYPNIKQVTDFLLSERTFDFSNVVAVEYPRKGVWSLGLVTGTGLQAVNEALDEEMLTVFIPSSPTPVTGYTITVRRSEVIDLPMTIDEALRFTVSGGVVAPLGADPDGERDGASANGKLLESPEDTDDESESAEPTKQETDA